MTLPDRRVVARDDVLTTALDLLREGGAEALSMRRLAARLGVSTQVVYSRVGSKPDVVRALHDDAFHELAALVEQHTQPRGTREHVHEVAAYYLEHAVADPVRFEVMFGTPVKEFVRDDEARAVEVACFRATWIAAVRAYLDATQPDREGGTAVGLAWRLWTAAHGIATVHLAGHETPGGDPAAELRTVVDLHLDAAGPSARTL